MVCDGEQGTRMRVSKNRARGKRSFVISVTRLQEPPFPNVDLLSVADGEAFLDVRGVFKFIDESDGIVVVRDAAFALCIGD